MGLNPVLWLSDKVRAAVRAVTRDAARKGFEEGVEEFLHEVGAALSLEGPAEALAAPETAAAALERPRAIPMPDAAQTTAEGDGPSPALDVPRFERCKELIAAGHSQREAARIVGVPESTLRCQLRKEKGE